MHLTFLGTGTSTGVPVIGCDCPVCTSGDPRNIRTRCSLLVEHEDTKILIDAGPDLREQALRENLRSLDAVLYTHAHLDHIAGFDELRAFCWSRDSPLPLHAHPGTLAALRAMFPWAFSEENKARKGYVQPDPRETDGPFKIGSLDITPLPVLHASVPTQGYRLDAPGGASAAYLPDVKAIPEGTLPLMENLDLLVIDALRHKDHPTHMTLAEALAASEALGSPRTLLTHLTHDLDYTETNAALPPHATLAHDGLRLDL